MQKSRIGTLSLLLISLLLAGCAGSVQAQGLPTLQPTETARPLVTPTTVPEPPPLDLPAVNWSDVSIHKRAMKPGFEADVDKFVDANRYFIVANITLEPDAVFRGAERVRYTNHSADMLENVVFRLYANTPALGGRMTVTHVEVDGKQIDPLLSDLRSVMSVPLPTPLKPGESVEIKLDFALVMTRGLNTSYGRFGYVNQIVSATAWYPTLSVYEEGRGWWESMPSPRGDPAYTETGLYDVRLTVPADWTVAASGTIVETTPSADGNTVTIRDVTGPMRDHAFQASARYMITPTEADGTTINIVHYKDQAEKATDGTPDAAKYGKLAVETFNEVFGQYPFAELDIAENPTPSGVEFPGLVQITERAWIKGNNYLEVVIAHEVGHQWFYSLVGNNQVEQPWLDESLTSYTEFVYMRAAYPPEKAQQYVDNFQQRYTRYTGSGFPDQPLDLSVQQYSNMAYGAIVYTKGPLFLVELERQLGRETVYKALAEYFQRHKYGVVTTEDVKQAFEDVSGEDLTAIFREWVSE